MKRIVYLINLILVTASCAIPSLKATVDDQGEEYRAAGEYLFTQASKGKLFTCYLCHEDCLAKTLRTLEKEKNNTESQMLVSSECLYCAFHTINNPKEADALVNDLYKFHIKCLTRIQNSICFSVERYSKTKLCCQPCLQKHITTCKPCLQKYMATQNQNKNDQSNPLYDDCQKLTALLSGALFCMPFSLSAH